MGRWVLRHRWLPLVHIPARTYARPALPPRGKHAWPADRNSRRCGHCLADVSPGASKEPACQRYRTMRGRHLFNQQDATGHLFRPQGCHHVDRFRTMPRRVDFAEQDLPRDVRWSSWCRRMVGDRPVHGWHAVAGDGAPRCLLGAQRRRGVAAGAEVVGTPLRRALASGDCIHADPVLPECREPRQSSRWGSLAPNSTCPAGPPPQVITNVSRWWMSSIRCRSGFRCRRTAPLSDRPSSR
jgi:hypothetical protein